MGSEALATQAERSLVNSATRQILEETAGKEAFDIAQQGGRHAGFLQNNLQRSVEELENGVASLERQIKLHQDKIKRPSSHIDDWAKLDPHQQQALIDKKIV